MRRIPYFWNNLSAFMGLGASLCRGSTYWLSVGNGGMDSCSSPRITTNNMFLFGFSVV